MQLISSLLPVIATNNYTATTPILSKHVSSLQDSSVQLGFSCELKNCRHVICFSFFVFSWISVCASAFVGSHCYVNNIQSAFLHLLLALVLSTFRAKPLSLRLGQHAYTHIMKPLELAASTVTCYHVTRLLLLTVAPQCLWLLTAVHTDRVHWTGHQRRTGVALAKQLW